MEIRITQYTEEDKLDVLEMMGLFSEIDGYHFDPIIREENLLEFISNRSLGRLYLIKDKHLNLGYIVLAFGFSFEYKGRDAFIDEFFIKEGYRNKVIGHLAMDFVVSESKRLNVNVVHLEVEMQNVNANKLYFNKGYQSNGRKLLSKEIEMDEG